MNKLFVYGTLMNDEVLTLLLGCRFSKSKAVLDGYQCLRVSGANYPAIFAGSDSCVAGEILDGISPNHLAVLDEYEGEDYQRISVTVLTEDKKRQPCEVYVFKPECRALLSDQSWSNKDFRENHMATFIEELTS